jgi:hypothetical protein
MKIPEYKMLINDIIVFQRAETFYLLLKHGVSYANVVDLFATAKYELVVLPI